MSVGPAVDVARLYCQNTDTVHRCAPAVTHLAGGTELRCAEINASCRPSGQQITTVCYGISNVHYHIGRIFFGGVAVGWKLGAGRLE